VTATISLLLLDQTPQLLAAQTVATGESLAISTSTTEGDGSVLSASDLNDVRIGDSHCNLNALDGDALNSNISDDVIRCTPGANIANTFNVTVGTTNVCH